VDEFLFIIRGREKYTSLDGTVIEVKAGDAVFVPRGQRGGDVSGKLMAL
jgi:uncharacterized cupin superfamily protein